MLELNQKYLKMTFEVSFEEVLNPDRQIAIQLTKVGGDRLTLIGIFGKFLRPFH